MTRKNEGLKPVRWEYDAYWEYAKPREVPKPIPIADISDPPTACLVINREWVPHVIGYLGLMLDQDQWIDDEDNNIQRARDAYENIFYQLASPCIRLENGTLLRQNPTNPCYLEQSIDNGASWSLAFDYSKCMNNSIDSILQINNYINETTQIYNDNRTIYNNDITNIANNFAYDGTLTDDQRDKALCYGLRELVNAISITMSQKIESQESGLNDFLTDLGTVFGGLSGTFSLANTLGVAILGFTASSGLIIGLALAGVATAVAQLFNTSDISAFEDDDAKAEIACCMYNNLKGQTPQRALWINSLQGCQFEGNAATVATAMAEYLNDMDVYLQFFKILNDYVDIAVNDLLPFCPCESQPLPEALVVNYDLDGYQDYTISTSGHTLPALVDQGPPNGNILYEQYAGGSYMYAETIVNVPNADISKITTWTQCSFSSGINAWRFEVFATVNGIEQTVFEQLVYPHNSNDWILEHNFSGSNVTAVRFRVWMTGNSGFTKTIRILQISVE